MKELNPKKTGHKGQMGFNLLVGAALGVVVFMIVLFVGAVISDEFKSQATTNASFNVVEEGQQGLLDLSGWIGVIVIVIVAVVILAMVMGSFGRGGLSVEGR